MGHQAESFSNQLLKRYILQAMKSILGDDQNEASDKCRFVYSFPFCQSAIKSLEALLANSSLEKSLSHRGICFVQLLRSGVGDIKVPAETGFKRGNIAVSFLEVISFNQAEDSVIVRSDPISQHVSDETGSVASRSATTPFVLCLEALPLDSLLKIRRWKVDSDLKISLKVSEDMDDGGKYCGPEFSALMADLLAAGSFYLQGSDQYFRSKQMMLADFERAGFVAKDENGGWVLTPQGRKIISVGYVLSNRKKVVQVQDGASIEGMEIYELLMCMQSNGWICEAVFSGKSGIASSPYIHGQSPKIWYQLGNKESVCREYLVLLLTAGSHLQPVPHLQNASVYLKMLGKEVRSRGKRNSLIFVQNEDVWFDESMVKNRTKALPSGGRKRRRTHLVQALENVDQSQAAAEDDLETISPMALPDVDKDDEDEDSQQEEEEADKRSISSSSGSASSASKSSQADGSDSESSSSSSCTDSSGSSAKADSVGGSKTMMNETNKKGVTRDKTVSKMWGKFRLTPTKTGWQMTCPFHQGEEGTKTNCTKTRSSALVSESVALHMLKAWAVWGQRALNKQDHQQRIWREVCDAQKNNNLPSLEDLDQQAV